MTRDVNVVSIDINEGQQLIAQLKDYIDRLHRKTQENNYKDFDYWRNVGFNENRLDRSK